MTEILRVVIDTNHIMSAILSERGASAKLIDWMTKEEDYFKRCYQNLSGMNTGLLLIG